MKAIALLLGLSAAGVADRTEDRYDRAVKVRGHY
jgi:hypothetical protein